MNDLSNLEIAKTVLYFFCIGLTFVWALIEAKRVPKDQDK